MFSDFRLNEFEKQKLLQEKFASVYHKFNALSNSHIAKGGTHVFILHSKNMALPREIRRFLSLQERGRVTLLSIAEPFPYSRLGAYLRSGDSLITSFSSSEESQKALRLSIFDLAVIRRSFIDY